jgi:hypothetical protein
MISFNKTLAKLAKDPEFIKDKTTWDIDLFMDKDRNLYFLFKFDELLLSRYMLKENKMKPSHQESEQEKLKKNKNIFMTIFSGIASLITLTALCACALVTTPGPVFMLLSSMLAFQIAVNTYCSAQYIDQKSTDIAKQPRRGE